jgi:hypothetical protein
VFGLPHDGHVRWIADQIEQQATPWAWPSWHSVRAVGLGPLHRRIVWH